MPLATRRWIVDSRGKPRPKMPLTSSTNDTFVEFIKPIEGLEIVTGKKTSLTEGLLGYGKIPKAD
jgi:hypothetical protein